MRLCASCAASLEATGWACHRCGLVPSIVDGVPILAPSLAWGNPIDAEYEYQTLHDVEGEHFWFTARSRLIAWAIRHYFRGVQTVFDVGCGTGGVVAALRTRLSHVRFAAGDALLSGLAFARQQLPDVSFVQLDLRHLPYDREFDLIGAFDVLEHLDEDELALGEMFRSTNPGGGIIVTVPQHPFLWSALDEHSHHRRRYKRGDLIDKVERAGYVVERTTSFMALTLPLQLVSRTRPHNAAATLDAGRELRLNPLANAVLSGVSTLERAAIRAGVSFPMGGSLLLVGRRPLS